MEIKNIADAAAVNAMRNELNRIKISGEIVIGEGEIASGGTTISPYPLSVSFELIISDH